MAQVEGFCPSDFDHCRNESKPLLSSGCPKCFGAQCKGPKLGSL